MNPIETSFEWFLSATARGSLMTLAVLLAQAALGRKLPAVWRHALWLPVLFVLGSPFLPESPLSLENRWSDAPVVTVPAGPVSIVRALPTASPVTPAPAPAPAIEAIRIAAWVWIAGVFAILLLGTVAWHRTLAVFRRRAVPLSPELCEEIGDAARSRGLRKMPAVLVSAAVPGPAMSGVFRPILLLPSSFAATFDRDERRLILLHEMTHVKRGDLVLNAIVFLLQAVHWCNPLIWFACARLRADRELACDSVVLSTVDEDRRSVYGHALLKVETATALPPRHLGFVGLVGLFGRSRILRSRLSAISTHRSTHPASTLAGLVLLLGLLFAGATRAQNETGTDPGPSILIEAKFLEVPSGAKIEVQSDSVSFDEKTGTSVFSPDTDAMEKLVSTAGADVMSAPSAVVLSGQKAVIEIGKEVTDATGGKRLAGVRFEVLPTLRDDRIELALDLLVTSEVPGSSPVVFKERSVRSKVTVRPNEVVMVREIEKEPGNGGAGRRLFLLVSPRFAESEDGKNESARRPQPGRGPADLRTRLDGIVIPELTLVNAPLSMALNFLCEKSRELDPAKQGVNIVHLPAPGAAEPHLTLSLRSVPLTEALRYVAQLSGHELEYDTTSAILRNPAAAPQAAAKPPVTVPGVDSGPALAVKVSGGRTNAPSAGATTAELAARLVLPQAEFREAGLPEVIQFLQKKSVELDPEKKGLNFILNAPNPSPLITLSLPQMPLSEALRYVAGLSGCELEYDATAVILRSPAPAPQGAANPAGAPMMSTPANAKNPQELEESGNVLFVRAYAFPEKIHHRFVAESLEKTLKGALMEKGIPFPVGATIAWTPQSGGRLIVRNYADYLELVDALVENAVKGAGQ